MLNQVPLLGDPAERFLAQVKEAVKAGLHGGMLFEELGFRYLGPIDGHDIAVLQKYLKMVRDLEGPILLHVVTEKGHGFQPAAEDPVYFHTPARLRATRTASRCRKDNGEPPAYTNFARDAIREQMLRDPRVTVLTAAMCQGNMLEPIRDEFPDRFFDMGICESHAVAFAAGLAKAGLRPIVDIYSTFLQRSFDQIFQEVALQNLPVTFLLDRAGLVGPDGPTHHGVFDLGYLRLFPNLVVMAPGDAYDLPAMLDFALQQDCAVLDPLSQGRGRSRSTGRAPHRTGPRRGAALGPRRRDPLLRDAAGRVPAGRRAAARRRAGRGRDQRPLRQAAWIARSSSGPCAECPFVVTVEEGRAAGRVRQRRAGSRRGRGLDASRVRRLGMPDRFIEHGEREELLADLGLDADGHCTGLPRPGGPDSRSATRRPAQPVKT